MNLTLAEIQKNEMVVAWWKKAFNRREFQLIWQMLNDTHPMRWTDGQITHASAEYKLGAIQGYELLLDRIKRCTEFSNESGELPTPTFEPLPLVESDEGD